MNSTAIVLAVDLRRILRYLDVLEDPKAHIAAERVAAAIAASDGRFRKDGD